MNKINNNDLNIKIADIIKTISAYHRSLNATLNLNPYYDLKKCLVTSLP